MQKLLATSLLCFLLSPAFCQQKQKLSTCIFSQYTKTLYDYTAGNNPWGAGLGLQTFIPYKERFTATIELTGDIYLEDDKVLRSNPDGSFPYQGNDVRGVVNLLAGAAYRLTPRLFLAFAAGPSFIHDQTRLAIKPSLHFFLSENQRWLGKLSYINVFDRTEIVKEDFGSASLALGFKLF